MDPGQAQLQIPAREQALAQERRARPWPPGLRCYHLLDLWERRCQLSRNLCLLRPQHIGPVDLPCPVRQRFQQPHSRHRRARLLVRLPRHSCHRELYQLPAKAGRSLLPSSRRTGEPTSSPAWCTALPNLRSLRPEIEGKDCSCRYLYCFKTRQPWHLHDFSCAKVGMVLTMSELRGCQDCSLIQSVPEVWFRRATPCCWGIPDRSVATSAAHRSALERSVSVALSSSNACRYSAYLWLLLRSSWAKASTRPEPHHGSQSLRPHMGAKRRKKPWVPPAPLDPSIIVDPADLVSGADIIITGGAHRRIHGLKGFILPSTEIGSTTFNVKLYQGPTSLQSKIWCVDRSNVAASPPDAPAEDDGLHPSLRWRFEAPSFDSLFSSLRPRMAESGHAGSSQAS